jgi:hypothetical protein
MKKRVKHTGKKHIAKLRQLKEEFQISWDGPASFSIPKQEIDDQPWKADKCFADRMLDDFDAGMSRSFQLDEEDALP